MYISLLSVPVCDENCNLWKINIYIYIYIFSDVADIRSSNRGIVGELSVVNDDFVNFEYAVTLLEALFKRFPTCVKLEDYFGILCGYKIMVSDVYVIFSLFFSYLSSSAGWPAR